jgi:hypothetical protein
MRHIRIDLEKSDYEKLEYIRGQESRSKYLQMLINVSYEKAKAEEEAFHKTCKMMSHMKYILSQIDKTSQGGI